MLFTSLRHSTQNGAGMSGATSNRHPSTPASTHFRVISKIYLRADSDAMPVSASFRKFGNQPPPSHDLYFTGGPQSVTSNQSAHAELTPLLSTSCSANEFLPM